MHPRRWWQVVTVCTRRPSLSQWEYNWNIDFSCKTHNYRYYHTCHHKCRRQFPDGPVPKNDNLKCVKSFQQHIPFYGTRDPIWVKIGTTDLHIMSLRICRFRENRGREIPSFLTGLNYHTCQPCACRKDLRNFKSNERLGKACVLRHGKLFAILLRTLWEHFLITTSITTETKPFFGKTMQRRTFLTYLLLTTSLCIHLMKYHIVTAHIIYSKS